MKTIKMFMAALAVITGLASTALAQSGSITGSVIDTNGGVVPGAMVTVSDPAKGINQDGFYYDRNEKKNQRVKVKSVAAFMPLWAGVATPRRARRIVKDHLLNEQEFWLKYPVASYAKTEPDYYQGSRNECNWRGSTWMPTNYMVFHGLIRYGFKGVARELADRTFRMVLEENAVTREYYNAETGAGVGQTEFWGFSILGYVMPLELELGYDPTDLDSAVKPVVTEHLGLPFLPPATARLQKQSTAF